MNEKQDREVAVAKEWAAIFDAIPEADDVEYAVKRHPGTDADISKELAKARADDPQLYDGLYGKARG